MQQGSQDPYPLQLILRKRKVFDPLAGLLIHEGGCQEAQGILSIHGGRGHAFQQVLLDHALAVIFHHRIDPDAVGVDGQV